MKLSRLFQPKNPQFWLLVTLNVLSLALSHIAQNYNLNTLGSTLLIIINVINVVISSYLAWRLVNS
jgi:drug/metabolite transporter (DMT)-like permease